MLKVSVKRTLFGRKRSASRVLRFSRTSKIISLIDPAYLLPSSTFSSTRIYTLTSYVYG